MTHPVSCGLLVRAGRVFLAHRSAAKDWYPDVWDFPGGHLEPGETSVQALVRELREELNVEVRPPAGNPVLTIRQPGVVLDVWRVDEWDGEIVNAAEDEHDALGWFSLDEPMTLDLADHEYLALIDEVLR